MREHALFSFLMVGIILVSFLIISLSPIWANPDTWKRDEVKEE